MSSTVTAGRQIAQAAIEAAEAGQLARVHIAGFAAPLDISAGSVNNEVAELTNRGNFTYHVALSAIYALTTSSESRTDNAKPLDTSGLTRGIY